MMTSQKPWFKFYPETWLADSQLSLCSPAAKGLLIDLMCLAHPTGTFTIPTGKLRAPLMRRLNTHSRAFDTNLTQLLDLKRIEKGAKDGTFLIPRMVEDHRKYLRSKKNGQMGGNPALCEGVNPGLNPTDDLPLKAEVEEEVDIEVEDRNKNKEKDNQPSRSTAIHLKDGVVGCSFNNSNQKNCEGNAGNRNQVHQRVIDAAIKILYEHDVKNCGKNDLLAVAELHPDHLIEAVEVMVSSRQAHGTIRHPRNFLFKVCRTLKDDHAAKIKRAERDAEIKRNAPRFDWQ